MTELERKKSRLEQAVNDAFLECKKFKEQHPEMKNGHYLNSPGSWLNGYREGDITFEEAIALIEKYKAE